MRQALKNITSRRSKKNWHLLFHQHVHLSSTKVKIIWDGEAGANCGSLYRVFLLYVMQNFHLLTTHLFGASRSSFFISFPGHIVKQQYMLLGQLYALAILYIGRWPNWFHPLLVKAILKAPPVLQLDQISLKENYFTRLLNRIRGQYSLT